MSSSEDTGRHSARHRIGNKESRCPWSNLGNRARSAASTSEARMRNAAGGALSATPGRSTGRSVGARCAASSYLRGRFGGA